MGWENGTKHIAGALAAALLLPASATQANDRIALSTNQVGLDLYRLIGKQPGNLCLSPYSIQVAFAMTANGAAGETLDEMRKTFSLPEDLEVANAGLAALASDFQERNAAAEKNAAHLPEEAQDPRLQVNVANRLFGQTGYHFKPAFLEVLKKRYQAPLQEADFAADPEAERKTINQWVEKQTNKRIVDLLPNGALNQDTRLVLVNALYFKAAWRHPFKAENTSPAPFHLAPGETVEVPTMRQTERFGYARKDGYTAVTLPYGHNFAMLLFVPDQIDGLAALEEKLTAASLASLSSLPRQYIALSLPKLKIEGETVALRASLQQLGMKLAFTPLADFSRMTSSSVDISGAYHKTFIEVDEKGTEAAAATAVVAGRVSSNRPPNRPPEVHVDRPFLYAVMDQRSGTALFLGRVIDPR